MSGDAFLSQIGPLLVGVFTVSALFRRVTRGSRKRAAAETALARAPIVPIVPSTPPQRRRLAAQVAPPAPARPRMQPTMGLTLPADAEAAFPELDLSLPDAGGLSVSAPRRRVRRTAGGGPAVGSAAWAANAVVAMEILGPPVSLRSGATLGAPHAF